MRAFTLISGLFLTSTVLGLPVIRRGGDDNIDEANPFNNVGSRAALPLDIVVSVPVDMPSTDSLKKTAGGVDLTPVTNAAGPLLKLVTPMLNSAIVTLTSADAKVKSLIASTKANATPVIATVTTKVNSSVDQVQEAISKMSKDGNKEIDGVQSLVGQIQVLADGLLADLLKLESSLPGVPELLKTVTGLIDSLKALPL